MLKWAANTVFGRLIQEHESDWEGMTIGLEDDAPVFVAYGAHCGGQWRPWSSVPATPSAVGEERYFAERPMWDALGGAPLDKKQFAALYRLISAAASERTHPAVISGSRP